jgi:hypothetical protein
VGRGPTSRQGGREDPYNGCHCYRFWDEVLSVMQDYEALVEGREMPSEAWRREREKRRANR